MLGTRPKGPSGVHDAAWLDATLGRLLEHVRTLLDVDGAVFLVVDRERRYIEPLADWYSSPPLRQAIEPANRRPYDPSRAGLVEYALERDRPLLLPRVEAWESGKDMLATAVDVLGEVRAARIWDIYRSASVIACPVKTAIGRALGVLVIGALTPKR